MATTIAPDELGRFRERLLQLRASIRAEAADMAADRMAMAESASEEGGVYGDSGDIASDLVEQEIDDALERGARAHLEDVEDALARIEADHFGFCFDCGTPVDPARLRALPWARRCLRCQSHLEAASGSHAGRGLRG